MALNFPDSPTLNQVYTDTTSGFSYQWDGVVWKSYTPSAAGQIKILDDISGSFNGSTSVFPITISGTSFTPANAQQLRIVLGGIVQEPIADYVVSGSNISFTTPPGSGLSFSGVSLGPALPAVGIASTGTVYVRQQYSPTGVQTTFTFSSGYTPGFLDVYHNGSKLVSGDDYTASNGSTFDLTTPAQNGDDVEGIAYIITEVYSINGILDSLFVSGNATVGGITTLGNVVKVGSGTTALIVEGDARITGILTIGTSSITLDGTNNQIKIGTGVTISSTGITGSASTVTSAATAYGLSGTPNITVGIVTASSFVGELTGNATGLSGTPNVTVGVVTATSVSVSGNVSIAGTLTYEDVTNVDSIGIVTARAGIVLGPTANTIQLGTGTTISSPASDTFTILTGGSERVRVSAGGSVGIGTDNPSYPLDVIGNQKILGKSIIGDSINNANIANVLNLNASVGVTAFRPINLIDTSGVIKIARVDDTPENGAGLELQKWDSGIGTLSSRSLVQSASGDLYLQNITTGGRIRLLVNSSNEVASVSPSGVGIGTTNPTSTLHVIGNILASGNVTGYSDETLKDNIQTIPDALSKVTQLRGVEFDRNDIKGNPHQIGVIAQEVEQVIPEVVTTHDDGIKSVAYGNLVGVLIEAIKELKEEVNELKARLEEV